MLIKIAGAGAGKTSTMAERIIQKHNELPIEKNIYCITFTNNAVNCITEKLNEYYVVIPRNIKLSTIHSFLYQEFINPYYFMMYGKRYDRISSVQLDSNPAFKNLKIKELEKNRILHVEAITERAKWVIHKKSSDKETEKRKRRILMDIFSKYCGCIFIDEAQDMDNHMLEIVKQLYNLSIPIELMGDPKQDLKGYGTLREMMGNFPGLTEHIDTCFRCPQKHLAISNTLVLQPEIQQSKKEDGILNILFESEIDVDSLITKEGFNLMFISQKNEKFSTKRKSENDSHRENLIYELEQFLSNKYTRDKNDLIIRRFAYGYSTQLINEYRIHNNVTGAMRKIFERTAIDKNSYAKIISALKIINEETSDKIVINSIEKIKGQEGESCLFILTNDLAPYLFKKKTEDNKTKNKLYVALTRSLNKLTIVISKDVEKSFTKEFITNYFRQYI